MVTLDLVLRIAAISQLLLLASILFRGLRPAPAGHFVPILCLGIAAYLLCPLVAGPWNLGFLEYIIFFGCFANPVFLWLAARAVFDEDFRLHPGHGAVLLVLEGSGFWHRFSQTPPTVGIADLAEISRLAYQLPALAIVVLTLVRVYQGRAIDLVEPRRRFRDIFLGLAGGYMILVIAVEIFLKGQQAWPAIEIINVGAIFALTFVISVIALRVAPDAFPMLRRTPAPTAALDTAQQAELAALEGFLEDGGYRTEGLTIGALAENLGSQESRLRRLINGYLEFRNFNEFLNSHRIQEAKERLCDPAMTRLPVLTIAMDLGFRSLGPFNRAFKEATGMTPSEYRRQHQ